MRQTRFEAAVIGASAGGITALQRIFADLPADFALPIMIVQHMRSGSAVDFALVFNRSKVLIKEAEDKETVVAGKIYFAPPGYHLLVERGGSLALSVDPPVNFARPAIDVLFETAAEVYSERLIGVILTGANSDGAKGLRAIKTAGGLAIVEDPSRAEVRTMPEAALHETTADYVLPGSEIGRLLAQLATA